MKKHALCLLLLVLCMGAAAQDVVQYGRYPRYIFNPRQPKFPYPGQNYDCFHWYMGGLVGGTAHTPYYMYKLHAPDSTLIYGVAAVYADSSVGITNADHWHLMAKLGKRIDGTLTLIDSTDRENGQREFLRYDNSWYDGDDTCMASEEGLVELYFDEPTLLSDSFYISVCSDVLINPDVPVWVIYNPQGIYIMHEFETTPHVVHAPDPSHYYAIPPYRDISNSDLMLIFPIVAPPCYAPEAPEADSLDRGVFVLRWDNLCDTVQVSVAPDTVAPEQGMLFTLSDTTSLLLDLGAGRRCLARLRCRCPQVEGVWSPWSEPVVLYHYTVSAGGDEPGPEPGNGVTTAGAVFWTLTPNPATGQVKVACAEAIREVEVYDMQGRRCLAQEAQGSETVLDISALAAGRYTVLLHTATATAAKALVVQ